MGARRPALRILVAASMLALVAGCVDDLADPLGRNERTGGPPGGQGVLALHFIDVGQADSILVVTPGGRTLLMDAGDRGDGEEVIGYLRAHGVTKLDVFVASHGDADHIGGVGTRTNNVLDAFPPARVYEPGYPKTTATYETFLDKVERSGAEYYDHRDFAPGDALDLDPAIAITFLHPDVVDPDGEPNEEGIVLRVAYGNFSALLPGDVGAPAERAILDRDLPVSSVLLKVGHHGSRGSSTAEWLAAVDADLYVLSVGADNPYGHPHPEALARISAQGGTLYRTDVDGSILVTTDGATWSVKTRA